MRLTSSYFESLWGRGGPFIGADRAHARVTVERDWYLSTTSQVATDDPSKLPFRWFQRLSNSQIETEVPNIRQISWDRSIDSDAASCTISIYNQKMQPNMSGQNIRLGQRGHMSWRQRSMNARARWPETTSTEWTEVLIPNALIRTYEGFGGHGKSIPQALIDGNLFLTGVWLVDDVRVGSDGTLDLTCRDMCKLLLEQQLYVPLIPKSKYPLYYQRWRYEYQTYPSVPYYDRTDPGWEEGPYFGPGQEGRKWVPDFGIDADDVGYAILGTDGGVFTYETPFYGSRGRGYIQDVVGIAKRPQNDGYWIVSSNGEVFPQGAAASLGSPTALVEPIVRIAATHTGNGYWLLDKTGDVIRFGDAPYLGSYPENAAPMVDMQGTANSLGYWMLSETGAVYSYGNAAYHGGGTIASGQKATSFAARSGGDGYWILATDGSVFALGAATFYGRVNGGGPPNATPAVAIYATATNNGYWILCEDGAVYSFGDATYHGNTTVTPARDMAAAPGGYWVVSHNGNVYRGGAVGDYGSPVPGVDLTPMRGIAMDPLGRGYWLTSEDGAVFAFGEAGFYGRVMNPNAPVVRIVATPSGRGYWQLGEDGGVFSWGDAGFFGSALGLLPGGAKAVGMDCTSNGLGYWIVNDLGEVYSFGNATYYGNAPVTPPDKAVDISARRPNSDGYWIVSANGGIFALGGAPFLAANGDWAAVKAGLKDPITSIDSTSTGNGYLLSAGDGGMFSFGDAPFQGALPAPFALQRKYEGNYKDLSDIIKDLLLWSGWYLYGSNGIHGNISTTGTYVETDIPADTFDKKPVIDAINAIRDIVGYLFWVDEEGGARFEEPNWYDYGNYLQETGLPVTSIPEIDERVMMTDYSLTYTDRSIRSEIIVTSDDPLANNESTITTIRPISSNLIRGMVRPAMIPTPFQVTKTDQEIMAELIEQHMHFASKQGQVTCVANPALQVNDQVRILEQVTGETDVHFIRGVSSSHDLDTGVWMFTLTTNYLGPGRTAANSGRISAVPEVVR